MSLVEKIMQINGVINGVVWGVPMLILIVGSGIYLSIRMGFFQFAHFGHALSLIHISR